MSRTSAFKGTWENNRRPYIVLAPDAYVAIQGQTTVVTCGECNRKVDVNKYLTGISTEASVDSPPGSANVSLSVPESDLNDLYVEGNFVIIPMMEIEIFAKGYYTVGGVPQYYRIFWGMVTSISKSWSNGVTTFSIQCKDILHWWEKSNIIVNPAFVGTDGASCGYQLFGNQFAGMNPYTIIIALAKEAMGDFSITDGSFTSHKPEAGPESRVIGQYAKDVMTYWQLKFGNIWNSLVLYGTSGTAYSFEGAGMNISPIRFATSIFKNEADVLMENKLTSEFKIQPPEIAAFKVEYPRAGSVQFFQNDTQSKLSVALTARDQIQYEFYCDTTGDIVFKPPFYNLNVIPNKPVSWINDFEIIDDNINDSEDEVVTHMTSSGNAFGGVNDYGITDEFTVPRTGVVDWHLLKRYGWRRQDFQCEWAGNPKKLFWFLLDLMDRVNAKRHNGTVTIPMRPEIRMGFPVWIPHYDSFYYVNGVSHNYSPGGQATTTLNLVAKRSKFIAPKNMGRIKRNPEKPENKTSPKSESSKKADKNQEADQQNSASKRKNFTYDISFDGHIGDTAGLGAESRQGEDSPNEPLIIRCPTTGKILGYPNVVMVYRTTFSGESISKQMSKGGRAAAHTKSNEPEIAPQFKWNEVVGSLYAQMQSDKRTALVSRIKLHRYEAGMSNAGLYDYAVDENGDFKEMVLIPTTSILWGSGTGDPANDLVGNPSQVSGAVTNVDGSGIENIEKTRREGFTNQINTLNSKLNGKKGSKKEGLLYERTKAYTEMNMADNELLKELVKNHKSESILKIGFDEYSEEEKVMKLRVDTLKEEYEKISEEVRTIQEEVKSLKSRMSDFRIAKNLNVSVRPVSDEYGFEVIGHNRYGRGVFVDRGRTKLKFGEREVNELKIQHSAVAGMITTPPQNLKIGLESSTFSEAFESMKPEDWVTGASTHSKNEVTLTSANTFSSAINHSIDANANIGAVFIEADATKRAKTIWELQPTLPTLSEVGFPACKCNLGKFEWYSILPKSFLDEVLDTQSVKYSRTDIYSLVGFEKIDVPSLEGPVNSLFGIYEKRDSSGNVVGRKTVEVDKEENASPVLEVPAEEDSIESSSERIDKTVPDFFKILNRYLVDRFEESYKSNEEREIRAIGEDLNIEIPATGPEAYIDPDSVLGPSGGSLFDRASLGDPAAMEALQSQVNWDWTNSESQRDELVEAYEEAKEDIKEAWKDFGLGKSHVSVETVKGGLKLEPDELSGGTSTSSQPQPETPPAIRLKDFAQNLESDDE